MVGGAGYQTPMHQSQWVLKTVKVPGQISNLVDEAVDQIVPYLFIQLETTFNSRVFFLYWHKIQYLRVLAFFRCRWCTCFLSSEIMWEMYILLCRICLYIHVLKYFNLSGILEQTFLSGLSFKKCFISQYTKKNYNRFYPCPWPQASLIGKVFYSKIWE